MSKVRDQYEAFPYPERNPRDEKKRLILGSPSLPQEIDHFVFQGTRDWSRPLRILVAGGGTGDGLIQLTTLLTQYKRPYEATYIDLSKASRNVAEARAKIRKLNNITFLTGSLFDAPEHGPFDYIDCCGVLHHLPDPDEGFSRLRAALAPGGGMGFMVYAPYGRSGVYPLQEAFGTLYADLSPRERIKAARKVYDRLPPGHPFKTNPNVNDHEAGDAGFYDLLLHSQDRAYTVTELCATLDRTGWALSGFVQSVHYDLTRFAPVPEDMDQVAAMAVAEKLNGTIRTHVGYAVAADGAHGPARGTNRKLVAHIKGIQAKALANAVLQGQAPKVGDANLSGKLSLPKEAGELLAAIDGRRSLQEIATLTKRDPLAFGALWSQVESTLMPWGLLVYSNVLR